MSTLLPRVRELSYEICKEHFQKGGTRHQITSNLSLVKGVLGFHLLRRGRVILSFYEDSVSTQHCGIKTWNKSICKILNRYFKAVQFEMRDGLPYAKFRGFSILLSPGTKVDPINFAKELARQCYKQLKLGIKVPQDCERLVCEGATGNSIAAIALLDYLDEYPECDPRRAL